MYTLTFLCTALNICYISIRSSLPRPPWPGVKLVLGEHIALELWIFRSGRRTSQDASEVGSVLSRANVSAVLVLSLGSLL